MFLIYPAKSAELQAPLMYALIQAREVRFQPSKNGNYAAAEGINLHLF
jgi:hypothetical protein